MATALQYLPVYGDAVAKQPERDSLWDLLSSSAVSTYGDLRYGLPAALESAAGTLTPEDEQYYQAWNAQKQQQAQEIAPAGAASASDWWSGDVGFGRFLAENVATMVPQLAGTVAGGVAGGLVGGPGGAAAGAVAANTPFFAGSNASRALQETGGITEEQGIKSLAAAPFQAAADVFAARFLPGAGKVLGPLAAVAEGNVASRVVKQGLKGAVTEALTETGQQVGERWAAGLDLSSPEANQEFLQAFSTAALVGGALGGIGGITRKKPDQTSDQDLANTIDTVMAGGSIDAPVTGVTEPAPVQSEVQQELPLVPQFEQFPVGYQADLLAPPTYDALQEELAKAPTEALDAVIAKGDAAPAPVLEAVKQEKARRAKRPVVDVPVAGAVEQGLTSRSAESQGVAAPVSANPEPTFEGLFQGVRLNQDLAPLRGKTPEEVVAGVRTLLENNDARKGTLDVAERLQALGLFSMENEPATQVEAPVEVTPPAAPTLLQQALKLDQKSRDAFVQLLSTKDRRALEQESLQAMGESLPEGLTERQAQSRSDAVVALTEKLGLTSKDGLTEAGRKLALKAPVSTEEAARAAVAQGYEGKLASSFLRGAEGKTVKKFDSPLDQEAYNAGRAWKVPETKTQEQTQATLYGERGNVGLLTDGGKTKAKSAVGRVESQNPEFARRDSLVETIDQRQAQGVYQQAKPEDVEQLRRMVREGATDDQVNAAEELVRSGDTLFPEPPAGSALELKPATITRGAPTTRSVERAQLRARDEINMDFKEGKITAEERDTQISKLSVGNLAAEDLGLGREATRREVAAARRAKAEAATAKRTEKVRKQVREQYEDSNKTPADRRKFMRLIQALNEGNVGEVQSDLGAAMRSGLRVGPDDFGDPPAAESVAMELMLDGKSAETALNYLVSNANNRLERVIAERVRDTVKALQRHGMKFEFKIAHQGDVVPEPLATARGFVGVQREGVTSIWLSGSDLTGRVGTDYTTLLHEMNHAATMVAAAVGDDPRFQRMGIGKAVARLNELADHITTEVDKQLTPEIVQAQVAVQERGGSQREERDAMVAAGAPEILADWYAGANNIVQNRDEILAWGLSDPRFQQWLDTVQYTPKQTLFGRFVAAVRDVLGLSEREDTALKALLQVSEDIMTIADRDGEIILGGGNWRGNWGSTKLSGAGAVERSISALKDALPQLDAAVQRVPLRTAAANLRKTMLGWYSTDHIAKTYEDILPEAGALPAIDAARHASHAKLSQLFSPIHQAFGQLTTNYQDRVQSLMRATEFGVDPAKAWEDQPWLHKLPNADDVKAELVIWNNDLNTLRRNKPDGTVRKGQNDTSAAQVYEDLKALNDAVLYSETAMSLSNLVVLDPELSKSITGFELDAMERFREDPNVNTSPAAARDYWKSQLDDYVKNVQTFIDDFRGLKIQLSRQDQLMVEQRLAPIETRLKTIKVSMATAQEHPYFHLGRHGDQFVSFTVRNTKGVSDKVAVQKVAQALEAAGLGDIYISTNNTKPEMYARFDTEEARAKADAVLKQLRTDGWLDPESEIKSGPRSTGGHIGRAAKPEWLDEWLSMVAANPIFDTEGLNKEEAKEVTDSRDRFISQMREMWLDTLSDTALTKVMVKRKGTAGYARDMMRNYSQRYQMHALAIANLSAAPKITEAFTNIRSAVNQARNIDDKRHAGVQTMFDIQNELLERHYSRDKIERTVFSDRLRAGTNAFFLGMSPGYLLTQVTQLGALLLPELGKKHGYSKSFGSIARNTGTAFKVMSAVFAEGQKRKSGGLASMLDGIADMAITPGVLQKVGLTAAQEKFLHKMIASGKIDIGSAARELGRVAEGEVDHKGDRAIRWATALGLYTETLTRITAVLSAQELYADGKAKGSVEEYAAGVLDEAMLNYASSNTARKMGKQGVLGQYTPLATQFMQYSAQLMQKLYREAHKAFGGDKEAMRFLGGHFAAVGALAGTLGLPFATIVATAAESLVDLFGDDDEPYDATAAWRRWLTEMFGETLGTTLARGVPRGMLNFDLSERVGEQDLLPLSDVISDRRSMKDSLEANTFQSLGAPISMMYNVSSGLLDIANGDVVVGMQKAFPVALANVVKGASLAATGEYKTGKGETLPIEGDGWDAMVQLMGLNPSTKAEYAERNRDFNELKTSATARATRLRNKIVRAILDGDAVAAREGIKRASEFDADNPDYAVLPDIESSLRTRVKKSAVAKSTGMPLGVAPDDTQARELLAY